MSPCLPSLAQVAPTADQLEQAVGTWGLLIFSGAILAGVVVAIYDRLRRKPPIEAEFASKHELKEVRKESVAGDDKVEQILTDVRTDIRAGLSRVHSRVDDVLAAVSEQKGTVAQMNQRMQSMQTSVENLPCRTNPAVQKICGASS